MGCQIDGYIAQAAHSLVVAADPAAPVTGRAADAIQAAQVRLAAGAGAGRREGLPAVPLAAGAGAGWREGLPVRDCLCGAACVGFLPAFGDAGCRGLVLGGCWERVSVRTHSRDACVDACGGHFWFAWGGARSAHFAQRADEERRTPAQRGQQGHKRGARLPAGACQAPGQPRGLCERWL